MSNKFSNTYHGPQASPSHCAKKIPVVELNVWRVCLKRPGSLAISHGFPLKMAGLPENLLQPCQRRIPVASCTDRTFGTCFFQHLGRSHLQITFTRGVSVQSGCVWKSNILINSPLIEIHWPSGNQTLLLNPLFTDQTFIYRAFSSHVWWWG